MKIAGVLIMALLSAAGAAGGQTGDAPAADSAAADSSAEETSSYLLLPIVFYTPETKLAGGVSGLWNFRPEGAKSEARPSKVWATFIYTQRGQYVADLWNELYLEEERYLLSAGVNYQKFPLKFWGVGPNTPDSLAEDYTPRALMAVASIQNRVSGGFHVGIRYEFVDGRISETEPGGILDAGFIPGSEGGIVSGVGAFLNWDTRDNIYYPESGSYHSARVGLFGSALGSDYDFAKYFIDLRRYVSLGRRFVFAMQGLLDSSSGVVPFQYMAKLGGEDVLRGYYLGRYRDLSAVVGQVELRTLVWWRVGFVVFAGAGNVANRLDNFDRDYIRYSTGFGLRYLFNRGEKLNLRMDFGWGDESSGMYITAQEAF